MPNITKDNNSAIRVLHVILGRPDNVLMIFANRQIASVEQSGIICRRFYVASRTSPVKVFSEMLRFRRAIKDFKPDIIHSHYGSMTAFFCAVSTRLPLVITFRGSDLNPDINVSFLRSLVAKLLSQISAIMAAKIICVSRGLKNRLWWKLDRVTIIPSGVDLDSFYPRSRSEARAELGWQEDELVVLFNAGRDPANKRLDLARDGINYAQQICGDIKFVVLNGFIEPGQIPTYMNAADCLILTSNSEGSPNVVKEALACNLPVVSVDVGDVRERLNGVSPSRVVSRDPEEIGRALADILTQRERSNGSQTVNDLSLEKLARKIVSVYESVLIKREDITNLPHALDLQKRR